MGVDLGAAWLSGADLSETNLGGANLDDADLGGADTLPGEPARRLAQASEICAKPTSA